MTFSMRNLHGAYSAVYAYDGVDVTELPAPRLLELSSQVARLRRHTDVLMAEVAAEMRRRSEVPKSGVGLAVRQGYRSAEEWVAQTTGGSVAEARRLILTGSLLADDDAPQAVGDTATAEGTDSVSRSAGVGDMADTTPTAIARFRNELAQEVRDGRIGIEVGALFTSAVGEMPNVERTRGLFSQALAKAQGLPVHHVRKLVWRAQALANPSAWEEREERQNEARTLVIRDDADGMVTLAARLTPIAAAPVRAVLDAGVRWAMRARRDHPASDLRTPCQMRADILVDLCKHALDCTQATSGVKTTVVVRMSVNDLTNGQGIGEVDGIPQPVSVGALRRAAADAEVIPVVLGGDSEVLDWDRTRRLFTPAQRLALVERDGGCAWCNAPTSWCEAHHIRWWEKDAGRTDLANAVLMCARCHHRLHRDGWDIEVDDRVVYFIPPASVDPARTRRPGGRHRFDLVA
jgi:hypothetical protein